jgi:transglutaminase-like putative cysteine protease
MAVRLRIGYRMTFELDQPTPMIVVLNVHFSRASDLLAPDIMLTSPSTPYTSYRDSFGNWCNRLTAPAGSFQIRADTVIADPGLPDERVPDAWQHPVEDLPDDALLFLLPSRYCDSDRLADVAWELFGDVEPGWPRLQAVNAWVHERIAFGYHWADVGRTAFDAYHDRRGVCRDYAHLGIAMCRALNIPARYCTGYIAGVELPSPADPMDFSAWFEAYLGGRWLTVDPRHLRPKTGRVLIARGRDAADVAITTSFGPNVLSDFEVWAHEERGAG